MTDLRTRPASAPAGRSTQPVEGPTLTPDVRRTLVAALAVMLGTLTIKGLISDNGWIVDSVLTVVVVTVPAALVRLRRRPGAFDVWIGVVLLVPWLTLRFVPDHALFGLIPTPETFEDLSRLMTDLHRTTSDEPAPVASTPAIRLVICALVGLVAALVDLIAVVGRRSALAGIPLLVVYTVSGAVAKHAVPWGWFALAAVGFLLLLTLDTLERRDSWGHQVGVSREAAAAGVARPRLTAAPVLGVVAIAIAVAVPFVVPVPSHNVIADALRGGRGQGSLPDFGAGGGDGSAITPFANLKGQLIHGTPVDLMTVHVKGARGAKAPVPFYLRTNVLEDYTAAGWRVGDHGGAEDVQSSGLGVDPADDQPAAERITTDITIAGLTSNPPVFGRLMQVKHVSDGTTWSPRDQLLLGGASPRGSVIEQVFDQPDPTREDLNSAPWTSKGSVQRWLRKPQLPSEVVSRVRTLINGAAGPYAAADAIQQYFTGAGSQFTYALSTRADDSGNALVDFLRTKQGFCQQYAAAEAIMFRQAGVPARVVLGYMHEAPDSQGNFTVTSRDAHAWVEAYFQGLGWIPFDPTPSAGLSGGAASDLAWAQHASYPDPSSSASASVSPTTAPSTNAAPSPSAGPTSTGPQAGAGSTSGSSTPWTGPLLALGVIVVLVALGLTPAGVRISRRRRRLAAGRAGDPDALWRELTDTALDLGYAWLPSRSPRQVAEWLGGDLDGSPDSGARRSTLERLAAMVERHRYGRGGASTAEVENDVERLVAPVRDAAAALRRRRSTPARVRAWLWPTSLGWSPARSIGRARRQH